MRLMQGGTRIVAATFLALLAACAPGSDPANGLAESARRMPVQAAGFQMSTPPSPDLSPGVREGVVARYQVGGAFATVFLFRRTDAPVEGGPDGPVARRELADATAATLLTLAVRAGKGTVAVREVAIGARSDRPDIRCTVAGRADAAALVEDYTCVTGVGGRLLKVRITARVNPSERDPFAVVAARFLTAVLRGVGDGEGGPPTLELPPAAPFTPPPGQEQLRPRGPLLRV